MDLGKLVDWVKLSPKYLLPIALASGYLLFTNDSDLIIFGLIEFVEKHRPWIGLVFLITTSLIAVDILFQSFEWAKARIADIKKGRNRYKRLQNLTIEEKDILLSYLLQETHTQYFPVNDGVVSGLELEGIVYKSTTVGDIDRWAFNIQPWAWRMLKSNFGKLFSDEEINAHKNSDSSVEKRSRRRAGYWY